jgi:membrane protease YdiL (CAAX protease family)
MAAYAAYVLTANALVASGLSPASPGIALNLVVGLTGFVLLVGGGLFWLARVAPADIGLRASPMPAAASALVAVWLTVQATLVVIALSLGDGPRLAAGWLDLTEALASIRAWIGQLAGVALLEEVAWRGFVLRQLAAGWFRGPPARRWAFAILASSVLFAITHVPNLGLISQVPAGDMPGELGRIFLVSLVLSSVFVATGNLWFTIGVHALANEPLPLIGTAAEAAAVLTLAVALVFAGGWWWLARSRGREAQRGPTTSTGSCEQGDSSKPR